MLLLKDKEVQVVLQQDRLILELHKRSFPGVWVVACEPLNSVMKNVRNSKDYKYSSISSDKMAYTTIALIKRLFSG